MNNIFVSRFTYTFNKYIFYLFFFPYHRLMKYIFHCKTILMIIMSRIHLHMLTHQQQLLIEIKTQLL